MLSTKDIGILIRDRIEGDLVVENDWAKGGSLIELPSKYCEHNVDFVDVSDANNPVIHVDNGQKFKIVILAV